MFKLAVFALAVTLASASFDDWDAFKRKYNKVYTIAEELVRKIIWQKNLQKILEHNLLHAAGNSSYSLGLNEFADMTTEEFRSAMNGLKLSKELTPGIFQTGQYKNVLPLGVDWRTKGYVTPIKNQGQCGSCWAFSATGSLEGQHFKAAGKLVSLSESNLVDCSQKYGNKGCSGGLMNKAFEYIIANKGIDTEASYPYKAEDRTCSFKRAGVGATVTSYKDIESGNEDALQKAVAEIGPVCAGVDASQMSFQLYKSGIYDEPACSSTKLNHGMLAVGYGSDFLKDYWIVKNSWGTSWGDKGYILMSRNKQNQCGIATLASYPVV